MDEKLVIFIYPTVCFVDKDLLVKTQQSKTCADAGKPGASKISTSKDIYST